MTAVKRRKLRLVWSAPPAPPAEPLALVALERHELITSSRRPGVTRCAARQLKRLEAMNARLRAAKVHDADDALAALDIAFHEGFKDAAINSGSPDLQRASDLLRKVMDWLGARGPAGGDPPRLVG